MSVIVHLAPFLQGGAGRVVATLARAQRRDHRVLVATSRTPEPGFENYPEYLSSLRDAGCELIEVDSLFKRDRALNESAVTAIIAALGAARPAIVHAHAAVAARIGQSLGGPVLQTMHGWSRHKSQAHSAEDLAIMAAVDVVVFPSVASREQLFSLGGRFRHTAVVPNGISSTVAASPLPSPLADLPERRAAGTRILLAIGSLTAQKNQRLIIEALPEVARRQDVLAVFVGEGPELDALTRRAAELGLQDRVRFAGYVTHAAATLQIADLLIQPSLAESFGLAVVEAFRAEVPVAVSTIPPLLELVADTGCGWTFSPDSPAQLAAAIHTVLSLAPHERGATVDRARQLFLARFTDDRMIAAYDDVYASLG